MTKFTKKISSPQIVGRNLFPCASTHFLRRSANCCKLLKVVALRFSTPTPYALFSVHVLLSELAVLDSWCFQATQVNSFEFEDAHAAVNSFTCFLGLPNSHRLT